MDTEIKIKRCSTNDADFTFLISCLDHELWNELSEDKATYDPHNKVPNLSTAVVLYKNDLPVACGCYKEVDKNTIEIKRMFVQKQWRGKGFSKMILTELENWGREEGYQYSILETSIHFNTARSLYQNNGYEVISNYGPYIDLEESICFRKQLK
jgi:putative acetyltransferase